MKKFFALLFLINIAINAQESQEQKLSGSLFFDSKTAFNYSSKIDIKDECHNSVTKKSPLLAGLLSFALPGAGEFYSESYFKSALFVAAEIAAITVGLIYDKKGDDQTISFQNYANAHWDVVRYARWTLKNAKNINANVDPNSFNVFIIGGKVNWAELNRLESAIGNYYSHRLAPYGDQQYYEMIGKYPQFNVGWDDFGDENTPFNYGDPLTNNFIYYSKERGKANDFYNVASTAVIIVVVNHVLSAVDAAWTASSFNKALNISSGASRIELGYRTIYYPSINLKYSF
jgi:hypothetical protein